MYLLEFDEEREREQDVQSEKSMEAIASRSIAQTENVSQAKTDAILKKHMQGQDYQDWLKEQGEETNPYQKLGEEVEEGLKPKKEESPFGKDFDASTPEGKAALEKANKEADQAAGMMGRIVLGGIGDAAEGTVNTIMDAWNFGEKQLGIDWLDDEAKLDVMKKLVPPGDDGVENFARGIVTFMTGFGALNKLAKGWSTTTKVQGFTKSMAIGAMADIMTFDPDEKNLSQLVKDVPELEGPLAEYLNAPIEYVQDSGIVSYLSESESRFEKRLKNGLEGMLIGGFIEGTPQVLAQIKPIKEALFHQIKTYRQIRAFKKALTKKNTMERMADLPEAVVKMKQKELLAEADSVAKIISDGKKDNEIMAKVREVTEKLDAHGIKLPNKLLKAIKTDDLVNKMRKALDEDIPLSGMPEKFSLKGIKDPEVQKMIKLASELGDADLAKVRSKEVTREQLLEIAAKKGDKFTAEDLINLKDSGVLEDWQTAKAQAILETQAVNLIEIGEKFLKGEISEAELFESAQIMKDLTVKWEVAGTNQGRSFQARKFMTKRNDTLQLQAMADLAGLHGKADAEKLARHIIELGGGGKLKKSISKFEQMKDAIQRSYFMRVVDAVLESRISGMLYSTSTMTLNAVSNVFMLGDAVTTSWMADYIGHTFRGSPKLKIASAQFTGMVNSVGEAFRVGSKALKHRNKNILQLFGAKDIPDYVPLVGSKLDEGMMERAFSSQKLGFEEPVSEAAKNVNKAIDVVGDIVNASGSTLLATDEFFKTINYHGQMQAMWAAREHDLVELGVRGADLLAEKTKFFTSKQAKKQAAEFSAYNTLTNALPKNTLAAATENFIRKVPGSRIFMPFLRVNLNASRYALERVPFVHKIPIVNHMVPEIREALEAGGRAADMALAKQSLGGMVLGMGAIIAGQGHLTGAGPANLDAFNMWRNIGGKKPYSIKFGDTWYPIKALGPLGDVLGLGADMAAILGHGSEMFNDDDFQPEEIVPALAIMIGHVYTPEYLTESFGETLDILMRGDVKAAERFMTNQASTFLPFSAAFKRARRIADPHRRETFGDKDLPLHSRIFDGMIKNFMDAIPGQSSKLDMKVNRLGQPVLYPLGWSDNIMYPGMTSTEKQDPVNKALMELDMFSPTLDVKSEKERIEEPAKAALRIGNLPKSISIDGEPYGLSTEEYLKYNRYAAGLDMPGVTPIYDVVKKEIDSGWPRASKLYKTYSKDIAKKIILKKIFDKYKKKAGDMMQIHLNDRHRERMQNRKEFYKKGPSSAMASSQKPTLG